MARAFYKEGDADHTVGGYGSPVRIEVNISENLPSDSVMYTAEAFVDGQLYIRQASQSKPRLMNYSSHKEREEAANEIVYGLKDQIMEDIEKGEPWQPNARMDEYGRLVDREVAEGIKMYNSKHQFKEIYLLDKRVEEITSIVSL